MKNKDKKSKDEQRLDMIEKMIENYENNQAGPYYTNRAQMRSIAKRLGAFKKKRYVLTDEDRKRLDDQLSEDRQRRQRKTN